MNEEQLKKIKEYIPFKEKGILKSKGITLLLEEKNYSKVDEKTLPAEMRFYETKGKKLFESIFALIFISIIGIGLLNENLKENRNEDLTIITIVFSVAFVGILLNLANRWLGDDSKRELIISNNGLKLNGWKIFKWENIQNLAIKKFPTGQAGTANFYLLIVDNEKKIHEFDINGFKGRSKDGIFHIVNSDYSELRNILWKYKKEYCT